MFEKDRGFEVEAGQTLILRSGQRHGGTADYPADLRFYWVHFSAGPLESDHGESQRSDFVNVPQIATLPEPERLTALFRRFLDDQERGRESKLAFDLLVVHMLCEVASAHASRQPSEVPVVLAQRVDSFVRTHAAEQIRASSIASALDYHPDYLGRIYRAVYGIPITQAIHRERMRQARRMLLDTGETIDRIAVKCGFVGADYFRRLFHRASGMSPSAYRRLYAQLHINTE